MNTQVGSGDGGGCQPCHVLLFVRRVRFLLYALEKAGIYLVVVHAWKPGFLVVLKSS